MNCLKLLIQTVKYNLLHKVQESDPSPVMSTRGQLSHLSPVSFPPEARRVIISRFHQNYSLSVRKILPQGKTYSNTWWWNNALCLHCFSYIFSLYTGPCLSSPTSISVVIFLPCMVHSWSTLIRFTSLLCSPAATNCACSLQKWVLQMQKLRPPWCERPRAIKGSLFDSL